MENVFTAMMWLAFGLASAYYAKKQKRNPYVWFFIGVFLGIFGLLLLLMLPLFQKFRKQTSTKSPFTQRVETIEIPSAPRLSDNLDPTHKNIMWYYLDAEKKQQGPMSFNAFERDWMEGKLASSTFIWNESLQDWKLFKEIFPHLEMEKG